jgi:hypothetical protein
VPAASLETSPGESFVVRARVHNLSSRPFPADATYSRRFVRLGTQLCDASSTVIDRDFSRAGLPQTVAPGAAAEFWVRIPAPREAGRYALKFDLVSEGIDWFEKCGSPTTTVPLVVG